MADMKVAVDDRLSDRLIQCVKDSVVCTFEMMLAEELVLVDECAREVPKDSINGVIGIISLVGDVAWSLMVGLPRNSAEAICLKSAGFEIAYDSEDMSDMVAELANVLAGDLSARLDEMGIKAALSLPSTVRGSDVDLSSGGKVSISLKYAVSEGEFWVKVATAEPKSFKRVGD